MLSIYTQKKHPATKGLLMGRMILQMTFFLLQITTAFVPRKKYIQKLNAIVPVEHKNDGFDLQGWEYKTQESSFPGFTHRYYAFPSPAPDAPVLLLIHGLNLDGRNFIHLRSLAATYRLLAYDFPDSSSLYTGKLDDFDTLLQDFITVMHLKNIHMMGVSFGGVTAIHFAARAQKDTIRSLILASSTLAGTKPAEQKRSRGLARWVAGLADYQVYWVMEKITDRFIRNFPREKRKELLPLFRIKPPAFYREVVLATAGYNASADASRITCPVSFILGTDDELFPIKDTTQISRIIPQAEITLIEKGTHVMTFLDGEHIARHIEEFLNKYH